MKTLFSLRTLCLLALCATFCGCISSQNTAGQSAKVSISGDRVIDAELVINSPWVARHVALTGVTTKVLDNGLLKAQIHLTSTDKRDYAIQYKVKFFDYNGMEIKDAFSRPWQQATLHGGEDFQGEAVASSGNVASLQVFVRPVR